jgi:hypothetical protein
LMQSGGIKRLGSLPTGAKNERHPRSSRWDRFNITVQKPMAAKATIVSYRRAFRSMRCSTLVRGLLIGR